MHHRINGKFLAVLCRYDSNAWLLGLNNFRHLLDYLDLVFILDDSRVSLVFANHFDQTLRLQHRQQRTYFPFVAMSLPE